ncbi:U-scoloptoxin(16)-Sm2a-like [Centruroides vittatus]|uniref:U-scoloptoxin(16)-Sm2a-like n=1 Tax=Centruroides vittatus TaxID=120091 RepID=UPI00350F3B85
MKSCALVLLFVAIFAVEAAHVDPFLRFCPIGGKKLDNGQEWSDNDRCFKYTCQLRGPDVTLKVSHCPVERYDSALCHEVSGKGAFPDCCPKIVCKK